MSDFGHCFQTRSADAVDLAKRYLTGLLTQVPRKNMERIDERADAPKVPGTDNYQRPMIQRIERRHAQRAANGKNAATRQRQSGRRKPSGKILT